MAGKGRPGPAKGSGGAPRKATHKPNGGGYTRSTIGPKTGPVVQAYDQRIKAGVAGQHPGHTGSVVDHINGKRADDRPSNLRVTSRSVNAKNRHPSLTPHPKRKGK